MLPDHDHSAQSRQRDAQREQPEQGQDQRIQGGHAASSTGMAPASSSARSSENRSGRSKRKKSSRYDGIPFVRHWETAPVVMPHISATLHVPPSLSMSAL